jgi:hypothetical protein
MTNHATSLGRRVRQDVRIGTAVQASPFGWFREYGKDAPIALFTLIAIVSHLLLRFVWKIAAFEALPLYLSLLVGGIPLIVGLVRQAINLEFGSDWLAGISIVTAALLHQYLVASIVILMLSGGVGA